MDFLRSLCEFVLMLLPGSYSAGICVKCHYNITGSKNLHEQEIVGPGGL